MTSYGNMLSKIHALCLPIILPASKHSNALRLLQYKGTGQPLDFKNAIQAENYEQSFAELPHKEGK